MSYSYKEIDTIYNSAILEVREELEKLKDIYSEKDKRKEAKKYTKEIMRNMTIIGLVENKPGEDIAKSLKKLPIAAFLEEDELETIVKETVLALEEINI